jgi:hypothetical protein
MPIADWALIISGGVVLAGIAYPGYARTQQGWKVGGWANGGPWALWYGFGGLAYLAGMVKTFGWWALLAAVPLAFIIGFGLMMAAKRRTQMLALVGPVLANLWFMQ